MIVPKSRRKVIYNQYRKNLQEIIRTLCKENHRRTYDARSRTSTSKYTTQTFLFSPVELGESVARQKKR